jgi:hypothetical protein
MAMPIGGTDWFRANTKKNHTKTNHESQRGSYLNQRFRSRSDYDF